MAATQDTSVLFSLAALQDLHETRVNEEAEARARKEAEEKRLAEQAEMERAAIARERAAAEARKKAEAEAARRAEEARLEAIRLAAIERARVEAETAARMQMMKEAEAHELSLARLREDQQKKRLKKALISCVASAVFVIGGGLGVYFGKIKPDAEAKIASQSAELNALEEDLDQLGKRIAKTNSAIETATTALQGLQSANQATKQSLATSEPKKPTGQASSTNSQSKQDKGPKNTSQCLPGEPGCDLNGNRIF